MGRKQPSVISPETRIPYSPECVEWGFSEVRIHGVLGSSAVSWCSGTLCDMAHIHSPKTGVCCLRYVASRCRVKAQDSYLPPSRCGPATQQTTQPTTCAWEKRR